MQTSSWYKYFQKTQCDSALAKRNNSQLEYGEEIYSSPLVHDVRWLVTSFKNEYNVFVEKVYPGERLQRCWGACFRGRDRAVAFALKMVLICSGKIHRKDCKQDE